MNDDSPATFIRDNEGKKRNSKEREKIIIKKTCRKNLFMGTIGIREKIDDLWPAAKSDQRTPEKVNTITASVEAKRWGPYRVEGKMFPFQSVVDKQYTLVEASKEVGSDEKRWLASSFFLEPSQKQIRETQNKLYGIQSNQHLVSVSGWAPCVRKRVIYLLLFVVGK